MAQFESGMRSRATVAPVGVSFASSPTLASSLTVATSPGPGTRAGSGDTYILNGITTRRAAEEIAFENEKTKRRRVAATGALLTAGVS